MMKIFRYKFINTGISNKNLKPNLILFRKIMRTKNKCTNMSQVLFYVVLLIGISALSITAGFTNGGDRLSIQPNIPELRMQQTFSESMQLADSVKNIGKHMRNVSPRKYSKTIY